MDTALYIYIFLFLIALALLVFFLAIYERKRSHHIKVRRLDHNPIISPGSRIWEAMGTFNPAAYCDKDGVVHILYRAIGADGVSRIGYSSSRNARHFEDSIPYPVFSMLNPRNARSQMIAAGFNPLYNPSGGSWSGIEDPRMVLIEDHVYVTFNVFDGWDFVRVGMTSIREEDLVNRRFDWTKPFLLSPDQQVNKNWVLFPEKINGKFALLHSINPEVQIEYIEKFDEFSHGTRKIHSRFGQKKPRDTWDTWVRSAGPPPLKTDKGWLVLYHATNKHEGHKYKLGAMLLDLKDPKKVIARAPAPILEPDMWYENDWKPGIVYACGAVIKDGTLHVYYGGGDKHVCSAETPIEPLLNWILNHGHSK